MASRAFYPFLFSFVLARLRLMEIPVTGYRVGIRGLSKNWECERLIEQIPLSIIAARCRFFLLFFMGFPRLLFAFPCVKRDRPSPARFSDFPFFFLRCAYA